MKKIKPWRKTAPTQTPDEVVATLQQIMAYQLHKLRDDRVKYSDYALDARAGEALESALQLVDLKPGDASVKPEVAFHGGFGLAMECASIILADPKHYRPDRLRAAVEAVKQMFSEARRDLG